MKDEQAIASLMDTLAGCEHELMQIRVRPGMAYLWTCRTTEAGIERDTMIAMWHTGEHQSRLMPIWVGKDLSMIEPKAG